MTIFTRPGVGAALVLLAVLLGLRLWDPAPLELLRLRSFDLEERMAPRPPQNLPVVIVEIDDSSLVPPYGQWPWPRSLMARLVQRIAAGKPLALGIDILFAEPDRSSPENIAAAMPDLPPEAKAALAALPHHDALLGQAIAAVPTVLGMGVVQDASGAQGGRFAPTPIRSSGGDPAPFLDSYAGVLRSLPEIAAAEAGRAALVGLPDRDGILRRVPLFVSAGGNVLPDLSLETLRVALGQRTLGAAVGPGGLVGARIGAYFIPTDAHGRAYPYFAPPQSSAIVSAGEVLDAKFKPETLADKIVLLGVTGLGLVDVRETPLGLMHGVEVNGQLLESILTGAMLRRPGVLTWVECVLIAAAGLVVILALPYRRPQRAAAIVAGIAALCLVVAFGLFRFDHLLLDGVTPALAALVLFGVMLVPNLRATETARRALAAEVERQRGELNAARAIQTGLLPPRLGTAEVEVQPLIEPARSVGGDFYDFVLLDPQLLFLAIADVSGKGLDAALFMTATKMVLNIAAVRHGTALEEIIAEANAKIAAASDDIAAKGGKPMFVTVFAGVLALDTGRFRYVSAGHDAPYVLRPDGAPLRLETEGGPPLGTLDDFPYPIDEAQLTPGDVLLLFTDGVTEAKDRSDSFYGGARLDEVMASLAAENARTVVATVHERVAGFVGDADQADDITLLAVRWTGPEAEGAA